MTTPPLLLGAALCFWGWHTGHWLFAVPLALLLEGARLTSWRWEFSRADFDRASNATSLIAWGMAAYLFATIEASRALTVIVQWLPLAMIPLTLVQAYGTADRVDVTGLFWTLRRRQAQPPHRPRRILDLCYPFVALCLLSAAAANHRTPWFYVGLLALAAWALWPLRSPRFSPLAWALLFVAAASVGYAGHVGLHALQRIVEAKAFEWVAELVRRDTDPYRSSTAIGSIGNLKLSDRIVLRIEPEAGSKPPALLREASYNLYNSPAWFAFDAGFRPIQAEADGRTWKLEPRARASEQVILSAYLRRGKGILALPPGTSELQRLTVAGMSRNPLGSVRVSEGLDLITYGARFGPHASLDAAPNELDLRVSPIESPALGRIAGQLGLRGRPPAEIQDRVGAFFQVHFRYATFLRAAPAGSTPLDDFLHRTRAGHCEYFATATVLLMRTAGVPARYATGYAVREWSRLEQRYVVRARHAHSWALVWIDGAWRDLDTTPAAWVDAEEGTASLLEPLSDLGSWLTFLFSRWRWGERGTRLTAHAGWLLAPLLLILAWRLYSGTRRTRLRPVTATEGTRRSWAGADSELYAIERRLGEMGRGRHPWEPLSAWVGRLEADGPEELETLHPILALHARYRFDPRGLSSDERETLRAKARAWLARHGSSG